MYFGHSGAGTSGHEGMEYMCSFLPKCFDVQYKNGVEVMRDMSVGIIDVYVTPSVQAYTALRYAEAVTARLATIRSLTD